MNTIDICKELHQNFVDFAYEANSQRAFPDARDGLKPGQRACLWEMYCKGFTSNKPHVKSAKISGGVIASWHPHGDVAVYETFARMSQPWINNIPEVSWHGSNGNVVIGSAPASSRYTEARLSKATEDGMLQGLKKKNVPMILNFSEDEEWPEALPAIMPRLLINGSQGIGVTIANVWLNMNLCEVTKVIENYLKTGEVDTNSYLIDFPSGGIILNKNDLHIIHETGKGKVILRAKTEIQKNSIIITELPYQVYVEPLLEEIKNLVIKEEIDGIKDWYNKSDKKRLLIEIECEKDVSPERVLTKLFKLTDLQKTYNANQWALVSKTPKLLNLKDYLEIYTNHNLDCIKREYEFDLTKAKNRLEIIEGLIKALEDIDNIIALIKKSESASKAKEALIREYDFTENQAKAIVDMKLGRLAHLEKIELNNEYEELTSNIKTWEEIISNKQKLEEIFLDRLLAFTKKYGSPRKTELTQVNISPEDKEITEVIPENVVVVVSQEGNIKRIPAKSFKAQRRNGKGVKTVDSAVLTTISTNTIDTLMIFTSKGKMYKLLVDNVPIGTNSSKGYHLSGLVKLDSDEKVIAVTSLDRKENAQYVVFITKKGLLKKTLLSEYTKVKRSTGIVAINLKDGDSIANVCFMNEEDILFITKKGMSIHFSTEDIAAIGRVTAGVKSIKLSDEDEVLLGIPLTEDIKTIAIFTEKGQGKKCEVSEFPSQGRGGRGVMVSKSDSIVGACGLGDTEESILIIGKPNSICISSNDIPLVGRVCLGNVMIKNSNIISTVKI